MKGTLLSLILALATLAEPAYAQFGGGIVLDMSAGAKIDHRAPRERRFVAV